jgi:hypothetical protein
MLCYKTVLLDVPEDLEYNTRPKVLSSIKGSIDDDWTEIQRTQAKLDCFAGLTLFAERGRYSGHVYQPNVNHRTMDFNSFHDTRPTADGGVGKPLIHSMLYPTESNSFSMGNKMSFYFYEVEQAEHPAFPILSPSGLSIDHGEERFFQTCRIKNTNAKNLSNETFENTLAIFSLKRQRNLENKAVCTWEIASFIEKICSYPIGTKEGLQQLVTAYGLGWLYEVNDDPLPNQLLELSTLIRAVTPMRVAAFDGRHRFNLCCYFATGFFHPTACMKLERQDFGAFQETWGRRTNVEYLMESDEGSVAVSSEHSTTSHTTEATGKSDDKINEKHEIVAFEDCAVFQKQVVCIATPKPGVTQQAVFAKLLQQGSVTTAAQQLVVSYTAESMFSEFIEFLLSTAVLEKFNNKNYWSAKDGGKNGTTPTKKTGDNERVFNVIDTNNTVLWDAFVKFLNASPELRKGILKGSSKFEVDDMVTQFHTNQVAKGTSHCFGPQRIPRVPNRCSTIIAVFGAAMKLLCDDLANFDLLRRFFQDRAFKHEQVPSSAEDKTFHGSMEYLNLMVMGIACAAAEVVTKRYIMEKTLILWATRQVKTPALDKDLKSSNWPSFAHSVKSQCDQTMVTVAKAIQKNMVTDQNMGNFSVQSTKVTGKLKFAAHVTFTREILKTICEYGFNPKIPPEDEKNQLLQLYLG